MNKSNTLPKGWTKMSYGQYIAWIAKQYNRRGGK